MLDAVLERVEQEEVPRVPVGLALIRKVDLVVLVQLRGDRDQLVATAGGNVAQDCESAPWIDDRLSPSCCLPIVRRTKVSSDPTMWIKSS